MSDFEFYGSSGLTLDGKGRISVPTKHRAALVDGDGGKLAITKHPDGCLLVFPHSQWPAFRAQAEALPFEARDWKRLFLGSLSEVEIDGAARVLIAPELRSWARFDKDLLLIGMGDHFELWDAARHGAREARLETAEPPESIQRLIL